MISMGRFFLKNQDFFLNTRHFKLSACHVTAQCTVSVVIQRKRLEESAAVRFPLVAWR